MEAVLSVHRKIAVALEKLAFEHREEGYRHHTYDDDIQQYEFVKRGGDLRALEVSRRMFEGPTTGRLCEDPVRNYQYLFVASITIACRFCIEGGMPAETAFNLSDLYIRQADRCRDVQAVFALHEAMIRDYTLRMQAIRRGGAYSRLLLRCMEYIDKHLQSPLTVRDLAGALEVSHPISPRASSGRRDRPCRTRCAAAGWRRQRSFCSTPSFPVWRSPSI